jgi:hypothetical protein
MRKLIAILVVALTGFQAFGQERPSGADYSQSIWMSQSGQATITLALLGSSALGASMLIIPFWDNTEKEIYLDGTTKLFQKNQFYHQYPLSYAGAGILVVSAALAILNYPAYFRARDEQQKLEASLEAERVKAVKRQQELSAAMQEEYQRKAEARAQEDAIAKQAERDRAAAVKAQEDAKALARAERERDRPASIVNREVPVGTVPIMNAGYFKVTVRSWSLKDSVNADNIFASVKAQNDIKYLIVDVSFQNTDTEPQRLFDGTLNITVGGKTYKFPKSETILADGWGLFLDEVNPLVTKSTKLVYKLGNDMQGVATWTPFMGAEQFMLGSLPF